MAMSISHVARSLGDAPGLFMSEHPVSFPQHHLKGSWPQTIHRVLMESELLHILNEAGFD